MKTNEITVSELLESNTLQVEKIKVTREEKINISIEKLESKESLNSWERLNLTSKKTEKNIFSLSKISKAFIENGGNILTDTQKECLSFEAIKEHVNSTEKFKDKTMFSINDVKLICNAIIKTEDKATKLALKVAKQGGTITQ